MKRQGTHSPDYILLGTLLVIVVFGLIMLSSASTVVAYEKFDDTNYYLKHQLLYGVVLGFLLFIVVSKIDYHYWLRWAFPLLIITILLLFAVFVPGIGYEFGGANRWINVGGILFQPTEVVKLTFLMYLATWLSKREKNLKDFKEGLVPFVFILGLIGVLVMMEPDMGTMAVIAIISLVVYFIAGAPWRHIIWLTIGGSALFALLVKLAPYRAARFTIFLNPELDPQGIGYHINQALLAIGSGGLFGLGLGHSRQKFNYLPEVAGDSIFAVIAEELGFVFCVLLIILYLIFMYRGYLVARNAPDQFGRLLGAGIVTWISFQAFINMGAMVSILPLTGITLPLISYGSSSMVCLLTGCGILANISKQTNQ